MCKQLETLLYVYYLNEKNLQILLNSVILVDVYWRWLKIVSRNSFRTQYNSTKEIIFYFKSQKVIFVIGLYYY